MHITMPIDLVKFYTYFFDLHNFYEHLLQKNIDDYEEKSEGVKVRENNVYFKFVTLIALNEAICITVNTDLNKYLYLMKKRWKC